MLDAQIGNVFRCMCEGRLDAGSFGPKHLYIDLFDCPSRGTSCKHGLHNKAQILNSN